MAKRATLRINTDVFAPLITRLDELGGNVKEVVTDALEQAAQTVENDTLEAIQDANLPAGGKYSRRDTQQSVVRNARAEWSGTYVKVGVGFDYSKNGAGGYLITGTPTMKPDRKLNRMYKGKKYRQQIEENMKAVIDDAIQRQMDGR